MKKVYWIAAGVLVCGSLIVARGAVRAQAQGAPGQELARDIKLTVYKNDFALVHEGRSVDLTSGRNLLRLESVSKVLDPMTVIFDWKDAGKAPDVVSNTYDLGVGTGQSLLKRLEGKQVEMLWNSQDGKPGDQIEGRLEATQDGSFVIRSGDKLYVNPNGTIVASSQQNLITMPQLTAEVDSPAAQTATLGVAYQTRGMSWSADYVGRLTADGEAINLECWATLENHTGIDYPNATITLVAGSPNRAVKDKSRYQYEQSGGMPAAKMADIDGDATLRFKSQAVGELYAYKVPAVASVGQEQMNRVKMINSTRVPVKKDYSIRLNPSYGYDYGYYGGQNANRRNANLAISLVNDDKSGLGIPLPAGAVRIYDDGGSESTTFVGAASLGDTPKNQHVNMTLSEVFDVYSDSRNLPSKRIDKRTIRKSFETVLHNEKKVPVDIRVVQDIYGKKHLVSESDKGRQLNAGTREWTIRVEAGAQRKLTWTADFAG
jgi:hypothetical protein